MHPTALSVTDLPDTCRTGSRRSSDRLSADARAYTSGHGGRVAVDLHHDRQVITAATGNTAAMNVSVGEGSDLASSFCARVLAGTLPLIINGARRHPVTRELPVTRDLNIGSYIGAPWRDGQGNVTGRCGRESVAVSVWAGPSGRYADGDVLAVPCTRRRRDLPPRPAAPTG